MSCILASNAAILRFVLLLLCLLLPDASAEWVETAKLLDSDGEAGDLFGLAVAIDNGILVVGAQWDDTGMWYEAVGRDAGSATIFELSDGESVAEQKLTASDAEALAWFGRAVAISNGVVAVGAPFEDNGGSSAGAVYIYEKGADGAWTENQKLTHSDATAGDEFGWSLAMQGNILLAGARGDDSYRGSVYIFTLTSGIWTQDAELTARDRSADDWFGYSVAIDGDTIVVGARYDDDLGDNSGSAYVFQRDGQGCAWTQQAKLIPSDGQSDDDFGRAVAIGGDAVWVGSLNNADGENVGAVYQFGKDGGGTWTQQNKLVARDATTNGFFGRGLAFRNGSLVVGAYGKDSGTGAVSVFQQESDDVWMQQAKLAASDGAPRDRFGDAVGVDDGKIIAGAYGDNARQGSVYAFEWRASETDVRPSVVPIATMQPSQCPTVYSSAASSILPSLATSVIPTGPTTRNPSAPAIAPVSTESLQPIMVVVFLGIAFLACGGAAWIYSRTKESPAVPNQDTPHNHRVVIADDISELEGPSVGKGVLSGGASVASKVHTLDAGTPTNIDHPQEASAP